jgi:hypothetical protein
MYQAAFLFVVQIQYEVWKISRAGEI